MFVIAMSKWADGSFRNWRDAVPWFDIDRRREKEKRPVGRFSLSEGR
jgi:hypothetical protein